MLTQPIKKNWFDMILSGEKKEDEINNDKVMQLIEWEAVKLGE